MKAVVGQEVGLYYDSNRPVEDGDYLRTPTGRTYLITKIRIQQRGEHVGRKHLRAVVVDAADVAQDAAIHPIHWYRRKAAGA